MFRRSAVLGLLIVMITVLAIQPAAAVDPAFTSASTTTDSACVTAVKAAGGTAADVAETCVVTRRLTVSAATEPTTKDLTVITQAAGLTAAATPIACRTWSQSEGSVAWKEKHIGKMCYDGYSTVWVLPYGYHYCDQGYGLGYGITVTSCTVNRVNSGNVIGGYFRQNWDRYQVHVLLKAVPVFFSHDMHVNVFPSGTITFKT